MPYPSEPDHTPLGERLRERTQPLAPEDERYGYAHAWLAEALSRILLQVQEAFDPEDPLPPVAPLLNPELCPDWALPWLAQFVGVQLPTGIDPDGARTLIRSVSGFHRGTPDALRAAAGLFLTGNKTVFFRERDGDDPYALEIVTLIHETPDPAAVYAAVLAQKPGGIILGYSQVVSWDYQEMTIEGISEGWNYVTLTPMFLTYADMASNERA